MGKSTLQYDYQRCGFMFVGKKRFLHESPRSYIKLTNIVETSNFVLQWACDVIWSNGKLRLTSGGFTTGAVDLAPHQ
jgi:hypothetical protein